MVGLLVAIAEIRSPYPRVSGASVSLQRGFRHVKVPVFAVAPAPERARGLSQQPLTRTLPPARSGSRLDPSLPTRCRLALQNGPFSPSDRPVTCRATPSVTKYYGSIPSVTISASSFYRLAMISRSIRREPWSSPCSAHSAHLASPPGVRTAKLSLRRGQPADGSGDARTVRPLDAAAFGTDWPVSHPRVDG